MAPCKEKTIPLHWGQLDDLQAFLDAELARQGCSAALRLRASAVVEELFAAAMADGAEGPWQLVCRTAPPGRRVLFRFLRESVPFLPRLQDVYSLLEQPCGQGVELLVKDADCLLLLSDAAAT